MKQTVGDLDYRGHVNEGYNCFQALAQANQRDSIRFSSATQRSEAQLPQYQKFNSEPQSSTDQPYHIANSSAPEWDRQHLQFAGKPFEGPRESAVEQSQKSHFEQEQEYLVNKAFTPEYQCRSPCQGIGTLSFGQSCLSDFCYHPPVTFPATSCTHEQDNLTSFASRALSTFPEDNCAFPAELSSCRFATQSIDCQYSQLSTGRLSSVSQLNLQTLTSSLSDQADLLSLPAQGSCIRDPRPAGAQTPNRNVHFETDFQQNFANIRGAAMDPNEMKIEASPTGGKRFTFSRTSSTGSAPGCTSSASSAHNTDDEDSDSGKAMTYKDRRREAHTVAEQKRRDAIKKGYDELQGIVPSCQQPDNSLGAQKMSKATILQKSIDYLQYLNQKKKEQEDELDSLRKEVMALKIMKANYEHIVKTHHQNTKGADGMNQVSDEVKFNVFKQIMEQLFGSFNSSISVANFAELSACVFSWLEEYCKPQVLRENVMTILSDLNDQFPSHQQ